LDTGMREALFAAVPEALDNGALARDHRGQINTHEAGPHAKVGGSPRGVRRACARDHRFGRCASFVDARAAHVPAFNDRGAPARLRERNGQRHAGLASPNDYDIEPIVTHTTVNVIRSSSATDHAWNGDPPDSNGASPSATSGRCPMPGPSSSLAIKGSTNRVRAS